MSGDSLAGLVAACRLQSVDAVRIEAKRDHLGQVGAPLESLGAAKLDSMVRMSWPNDPPPDRVSYICTLIAWWETEGKTVASLEVDLRLAYSMARQDVIPPDLVILFGEEVAMHHAWPFLRERGRVLSAELALPTLLLPIRPLMRPRP